MHARQLEAFRAIARTGTVTAAAATLHISQPAVSRLLAHLEAQLALELFSRTQGRLRITPEGAALLREVERHFVGLDTIRAAARRIAEHGPGSLRILGFPSISSGALPPVVAELLTKHPGTSITLDTDTTDRIAPCVESGAYDVGFTAGRVSDGHAVQTRAVASRRWLCAFPQDHTLASQPKVSLTDLRTHALVGFSPGMSLRGHIDRLFHERGQEPHYGLCAQTIESICALVAQGCGVAIIHPYARHVAENLALQCVELAEPAVLELVAVTTTAHARIVDEFIALVERAHE